MVGRQHNNRGRSTGRPAGTQMKAALGLPRDVGFNVPVPGDILDGPILPVLSHPALKTLLAIMAEHATHRGFENGALQVPYASLVESGMSRKSIPVALADLEAVGLVAVQRGRRSYGRQQLPNLYRLTWLGTPDGALPTNEWKKVASVADAERRIEAARERLLEQRSRARADNDEGGARCAS